MWPQSVTELQLHVGGSVRRILDWMWCDDMKLHFLKVLILNIFIWFWQSASIPVDLLLMMFENVAVVLFSVSARLPRCCVYYCSCSVAPRGSLCLLISWLVCLHLNTQGNHGLQCSAVQNHAEEKYTHECRRQNQFSFVLSNKSTPMFSAPSPLSYCKKCKLHHKNPVCQRFFHRTAKSKGFYKHNKW